MQVVKSMKVGCVLFVGWCWQGSQHTVHSIHNRQQQPTNSRTMNGQANLCFSRVFKIKKSTESQFFRGRISFILLKVLIQSFSLPLVVDIAHGVGLTSIVSTLLWFLPFLIQQKGFSESFFLKVWLILPCPCPFLRLWSFGWLTNESLSSSSTSVIDMLFVNFSWDYSLLLCITISTYFIIYNNHKIWWTTFLCSFYSLHSERAETSAEWFIGFELSWVKHSVYFLKYFSWWCCFSIFFSSPHFLVVCCLNSGYLKSGCLQSDLKWPVVIFFCLCWKYFPSDAVHRRTSSPAASRKLMRCTNYFFCQHSNSQYCQTTKSINSFIHSNVLAK